MLPTLRDRPTAPRHEGLLAASAGHRQTAMSTWARAALDRSEKLLSLCAPVDNRKLRRFPAPRSCSPGPGRR